MQFHTLEMCVIQAFYYCFMELMCQLDLISRIDGRAFEKHRFNKNKQNFIDEIP